MSAQAAAGIAENPLLIWTTRLLRHQSPSLRPRRTTQELEPPPEPEAEAAQNEIQELEHYYNPGGSRVSLLHRNEAAFNQKVVTTPFTFTETAACTSHAMKRWVMVVASGTGVAGTKEALNAFVGQNSFTGNPFFVGKRGDVDELIVLWRCLDRHRHRPKPLAVVAGARLELLTIARGGNQKQKLVDTVTQAISGCAVFVSTLSVQYTGAVAEDEDQDESMMKYEDAFKIVADWGTERFVAFVENARLKKKHWKVRGDYCLLDPPPRF